MGQRRRGFDVQVAKIGGTRYLGGKSRYTKRLRIEKTIRREIVISKLPKLKNGDPAFTILVSSYFYTSNLGADCISIFRIWPTSLFSFDYIIFVYVGRGLDSPRSNFGYVK